MKDSDGPASIAIGVIFTAMLIVVFSYIATSADFVPCGEVTLKKLVQDPRYILQECAFFPHCFTFTPPLVIKIARHPKGVYRATCAGVMAISKESKIDAVRCMVDMLKVRTFELETRVRLMVQLEKEGVDFEGTFRWSKDDLVFLRAFGLDPKDAGDDDLKDAGVDGGWMFGGRK